MAAKRSFGWVYWVTLGILFSISLQASATTRIAAASSLQLALSEIAEAFLTDFPDADLSLTFGSSGVIASQIQQGAPFELFLSADVINVDRLESSGWIGAKPYDYALGQLAFYSRQPLDATTARDALNAWLEVRGEHSKIAIANPRHAPFGIAAEGWLSHLDQSDRVRGFLVQGENVAQAVQFVLSGSAETGIVAWSLLKNRDDLQGYSWLIPTSEYPPLVQRAALIKGAGQTAQDFYQFIQTPKAKQMFIHHGFGALE